MDNQGKKIKINKLKKINKDIYKLPYKKIEFQLDHLVKGQEVNRQEFQLGFIGLATQNQELLDLNNHLSEQLKKVVEELDILKKEK